MELSDQNMLETCMERENNTISLDITEKETSFRNKKDFSDGLSIHITSLQGLM